VGSHERFVYNDELMKKGAPHRLDLELQPEVHVYGSKASYYREMEELIRLTIGGGAPRIDEFAIRMGRKIYDDYDVSYKNNNEFIMHSF